MTAGNTSGLNDGAGALLLANEEVEVPRPGAARANRVLGSGWCGASHHGHCPVEASTRALAKAGLRFEDMEVIELNEAFAAQSLAASELGTC